VRYCGFVVIVAVLCLCNEASAQAAGIRGMVKDEDGRPLEGVWLEARKARTGVLDSETYDGEPFTHTRSLSDGTYSLHGIDAGLWLFTVVRCGSQTDSGMVELVRELTRREAIPSVPIARILQCYVAGKTVVRELNIVLGSGKSPMRCRLVGSKLRAEQFGYQVSMRLWKPTHSGPGVHVEEFSGSDIDSTRNPFYYYGVPDVDGNADLGGVSLGEYGEIAVDAFTLDSEQPSVFGTVFFGARRDLHVADGAYDIPVRPHGIVHLAAKSAEVDASGGVVYTIWDEEGSEGGRYDDGRGGGVALILNDGAYAVRAMCGNLVSPLTPMIVGQGTGSVPLSLAMEPCAPYSVRIVDQDGKGLDHYAIRLNIVKAPGVVAPIGPSLFCLNGQVSVENIRPGEYEAQFQYSDRAPFVQPLRLGADEVARVVVPPAH